MWCLLENKDYETSFNCQDVSLINGSVDACRQKTFLVCIDTKGLKLFLKGILISRQDS